MLDRLLLALILLASPVFGAVSISSSTSTNVVCNTQVKSVKHTGAVPTTTTTKHLPDNVVVVRTTSHPTITVTPSASTTTQTSVVTSTSTVTDIAITDTFSTTSTIVSIFSTTTTSTETDTSTAYTTTTTTSVSYIQPTASIVPVDQSTGDSNYAGSKRRGLNAHPHGNLVARAQTNGKVFNPSKLDQPWAVSCVDSVQIHYTVVTIITGSTITKTAATPTSTVETTSTTVSTSTVVPTDVSTTLSFSTTSSTTITAAASTTTTVSTTSTVTATSTTSSYAACGTNNVLGPQLQNGDYISVQSANDGNAQVIAVDVTSGYDCCVACLTTAGCQWSVVNSGTYCLLVTDTAQTCDPNYNAGSLYYTNDPGEDGYYPEYVSNGYCGYLVDGGYSQ